MIHKEAAERIAKLREAINKYRYQYHVLDALEISESALDALKHELKQLEDTFPDLITSDSPTQRVAGFALDKFKKFTHDRPMLSIEDVFSFTELREWETRITKLTNEPVHDFYAMVKVDGLAMSLIYIDGILISAATRGDGAIGEDVTHNVRTIESIPLRLQGSDVAGRIEVRGEVYVPKSGFDALNEEQKKKNLEPFANPRNLAAGSIRQLDPSIAASRPLAFFAWRLESDSIERQDIGMTRLKELGFSTPPGARCSSLAEIQEFFTDLAKRRSSLNFWIDGVVIRVNDTATFESLGVVGKTPRGIVAWKFPPEEATTIVQSVDWSVGRTGVLTPVATVTPTFIAGTTVTHATLHNVDEIERLGLRIGDSVILTKAGDIIPKITKVIIELRTGREIAIEIPSVCPMCGSSVIRRNGEVALVCVNPNCFAVEVERLLHAARAFTIDGLGDKILEKLFTEKIIVTPPDIFKLAIDDLKDLEGFGDVSAKKIVTEINARRSIALDKFIVALGIRHVGGETAFALSLAFGTIDALKVASKEQLLNVPDVGETVAQSIVDFFATDYGSSIIDHYRSADVIIEQAKKVDRILAGKTFVVTGTLESMGRDDAQEKIRLLGGSVSSSVSKKTSFLVAGESAGSKLATAQSLNVPILSEAEFLRMIGE